MASTAPYIVHNSKRTVWFWQSNPNPWNEKEQKQWKRYSDFENDFIEEAFQKKEKEIQLNDYVINFTCNIQFKKEDRNRQRPLKREEVDFSKYVREERFAYPERAVKSFESTLTINFVEQWRQKNEQLQGNCPVIAKLAVQGILKEGKLLNQEFDAHRMADQLRSALTEEEILKCAAHLYSVESFLYKLINSTMRSYDMSKVDSLGPFCYLLEWHVACNQDIQVQFLYRGMMLTDEMVDEYRQAVGLRAFWPAFTSTTQDRRIAEQFGNVLFIISMGDAVTFRSNISSLSEYPHEQEVLLQPQSKILVDRIERDPLNGKHLIYMKAD